MVLDFSNTILPTNVFNFKGDVCIQDKAIWESVCKYTLTIGNFSVFRIRTTNLDNSRQADSSSLGIVIVFKGATCDLLLIKWYEVCE